MQKKKKSDAELKNLSKINLNYIIDPNVKWKSIKLLEDNIENLLPRVWWWLLGYNIKGRIHKKMNELDIIKIKNFCWERIFVKEIW